MYRLDTVTMRELLPPNFHDDPDAVAASAAVAPDYQRLFGMLKRVLVFADLDQLSGRWLDLLAEDLHVDYYDRTLPEVQKRELVRQSIPLHRKKGTPWAVEELIHIVFGEGYVREWFEYGGQPYHFKVYSSNPLATPEDARRFRAALASVQNLRSVLEEIHIERTWGNVLDRDYFTWEQVLGLRRWAYANKADWQTAKNGKWSDMIGIRLWGEVYSYIWEG